MACSKIDHHVYVLRGPRLAVHRAREGSADQPPNAKVIEGGADMQRNRNRIGRLVRRCHAARRRHAPSVRDPTATPRAGIESFRHRLLGVAV